MRRDRSYFFCGIGGSGMLPLALMVQDRGLAVAGSDRSLDQGRTADKFAYLKARGIPLFPQDGSGITDAATILVTSAAVEDSVPDVQAARRVGASRMTRAELLADLFNAARLGIGIAGTSGKSTTTGMAGWILRHAGRDSAIVNGAVMKNFISPAQPFASAVPGRGEAFVCEIDESDGSIALFDPAIAVVTNIAFDHKPLEELRRLFAAFCAKAQTAVLSLDNAETARLAEQRAAPDIVTTSLGNPAATLSATALEPAPDGIAFVARDRRSGFSVPVRLRVPGHHNVANALAALAAAEAAGVALADGAAALADFAGIRRRLEVTGTANGVTVIDDFAHNPDKIAATLATLHAFPGRLLVLFQPHGFGPLKLMKDDFIACFADGLTAGDVLAMPDPVYFGGTVAREVGGQDIVTGVKAAGRTALFDPDRAALGGKLVAMARPGDRIVVMGARDDSLSQLAATLVQSLSAKH